MARLWLDMKNDVKDWIEENEYINEIEKEPAKRLCELHFQLMSQVIGNLELVRRRAEQGDVTFRIEDKDLHC